MANGKKSRSVPVKTNWEEKITNEAPDFRAANLEREVFSGISLKTKDFRAAILRNAEFIGCDLSEVNFADADLSGANFRNAKLENVDFSNANLSRANFYKASLMEVVFTASNLFMTNFREAIMGQVVFAELEMETCVGLDSIKHAAPSSIGVECLYQAGASLPMQFLKGVGLPQILIDYLPDLVEAGRPIQFHSCFISYSHEDEVFARKLWSNMRNERIRVWYAPEEMKGGKKLFEQIDRAIHLHDKLLIVLSKSSITSNWVQTELRRARRQEKLDGKRKLFPIRLCDMQTLKEWECFDSDSGLDIAQEVREFFIPDFSDWKSEEKFRDEFKNLCGDLQKEGVRMSEEMREELTSRTRRKKTVNLF
ncbi:MAG TPA: toll/interleukin-1 receptor domain-containing protein [Verrucomicrobiae bacterium]|nr:toll/interleukin-1 receptor domain-containing protein [Verrucomicrobiae bacterium]